MFAGISPSSHITAGGNQAQVTIVEPLCLRRVFGEFEGNADPEATQGSGDVKYHLGASGIQRTASGRPSGRRRWS